MTFGTWDPSDIWWEWSMIMWQKDKKTKRPTDWLCWTDQKTKRLKESLILWCQGSFSLLWFFHSFNNLKLWGLKCQQKWNRKLNYCILWCSLLSQSLMLSSCSCNVPSFDHLKERRDEENENFNEADKWESHAEAKSAANVCNEGCHWHHLVKKE